MINLNPIILVVDDDPNDLFFIQAAFAFAGVRSKIQTAGSGREAIEYFMGAGAFADRQAHPLPDFVVTDLKMSDGDGFSVLEFLQKNPGLVAVPALVLSGSQDNDDIKKAYQLGAGSYHVKPSSTHDLRHLVKTLYAYWLVCEAPGRDSSGRLQQTESRQKLGERYSPEVFKGASAPSG